MAVNEADLIQGYGVRFLSKNVGICFKGIIDICRKVLEGKDGRDEQVD